MPRVLYESSPGAHAILLGGGMCGWGVMKRLKYSKRRKRIDLLNFLLMK